MIPEDEVHKHSHHSQDIQLPRSPLKKDSREKLLNQLTDRPLIYERERMEAPQSRKDIKITHDLDYRGQKQKFDQFCFPKFLTDLGSCCIPCKIFCSCCFCECCPCKGNPLFRQEMQSLGLLQQWGRFRQVLDPGLHVINPISQSVIQINQQTQMLQYGQVCISKDNVQFQVVVAIFYRFFDSLRAAYMLGGMNAKECVIELASGSMRSIAGQNILQEIIENRSLVSHRLTEHLNKMLSYWGIYVEISCLREIRIHQQIQQALQAVATTKRLSEALIINFRAQVSCASLYKQISEILNTKAAFQIRYLNMVQNILNNNQENVLFMKTQLNEKGFEDSEGTPLFRK